jgi:hypothetical protein
MNGLFIRLGFSQIFAMFHPFRGAIISLYIVTSLRSASACYHSVQNLLFLRLLPKNLKIKIHRTIILPIVLYGFETWSLTLREERKMRVFENMVLRRIFGPRRDKVTGEWRRFHN